MQQTYRDRGKEHKLLLFQLKKAILDLHQCEGKSDRSKQSQVIRGKSISILVCEYNENNEVKGNSRKSEEVAILFQSGEWILAGNIVFNTLLETGYRARLSL